MKHVTKLAPALTAGLMLSACGSNETSTGTPSEPELGGAYLQITAEVSPENRAPAAAVYQKYLQPFMDEITGANMKKLLVRDDVVQVLHGFDSLAQANAYLDSSLFKQDVLVELGPLLSGEPQVRSYDKLPIAGLPDRSAMAYLEITVEVDNDNRLEAANVYKQYLQPFLGTIEGAVSKELIIRDDDVQVLHGFSNVQSANAYLESALFKQDVVVALSPYLNAEPEVRVYEVFSK